jgi:hypothetical protein
MNEQYTVQLKPRQYQYLQEMARKYGLPDVSKALRCLIDFAIESPQQEKDIFQTVRCKDCS